MERESGPSTRPHHPTPGGLIMTDRHDSPAVADALAAVRDAVDRCRVVLAQPGRHPVADLLDTAAATSDLTAKILHLAAPLADEDEPGTELPLERAADLAADTRHHVITALHLIAGAHAIAAMVVTLRRAITPPARRRWWPGWAAVRSRAARLWQEAWMPPDPDLSRAP